MKKNVLHNPSAMLVCSHPSWWLCSVCLAHIYESIPIKQAWLHSDAGAFMERFLVCSQKHWGEILQQTHRRPWVEWLTRTFLMASCCIASFLNPSLHLSPQITRLLWAWKDRSTDRMLRNRVWALSRHLPHSRSGKAGTVTISLEMLFRQDIKVEWRLSVT